MSNQESELITQILNGEGELYGILIDRYKTGLYHHCFKIVRDEDIAEDIAQDSFIQAYQKLSSYDRIHRFSTWLYQIAARKALDYLRRHRDLRIEDYDLERLVSNLPAPEDNAYHSQLRQAVERLPAPYRTAVNLRYWEDRPYSEIATIMDAPLGSVKVWVNRAKALLRKDISS